MGMKPRPQWTETGRADWNTNQPLGLWATAPLCSGSYRAGENALSPLPVESFGVSVTCARHRARFRNTPTEGQLAVPTTGQMRKSGSRCSVARTVAAAGCFGAEREGASQRSPCISNNFSIFCTHLSSAALPPEVPTSSYNSCVTL